MATLNMNSAAADVAPPAPPRYQEAKLGSDGKLALSSIRVDVGDAAPLLSFLPPHLRAKLETRCTRFAVSPTAEKRRSAAAAAREKVLQARQARARQMSTRGLRGGSPRSADSRRRWVKATIDAQLARAHGRRRRHLNARRAVAAKSSAKLLALKAARLKGMQQSTLRAVELDAKIDAATKARTAKLLQRRRPTKLAKSRRRASAAVRRERAAAFEARLAKLAQRLASEAAAAAARRDAAMLSRKQTARKHGSPRASAPPQ